MRFSWRVELPQLILIVLMFLAAGIAWFQVPERIPVHWNAHGQVDRHGGRFEGLLLTPLIAAGLYGLLLALPALDPRRKNYLRFEGAYAVLRLAMTAFLALIHGLLIASAFGLQIPAGPMILMAMGVLFIALGPCLRDVKPNWFVGVRTPWTLSSDLAWEKTHRLASWLFPVSGLGFILSGVFPGPATVIAAVALVLAASLGLVIYSYYIWRSDDHMRRNASSPSG